MIVKTSFRSKRQHQLNVDQCWEVPVVIGRPILISRTLRSSGQNPRGELENVYSNLFNRGIGRNYRILRKNLDQGSVIIFDQ